MKKKIVYPDNKLTRKMNEQGWETVEQFYQHSEVNQVVSRETCRQLILHQKKIIEPLFIKITEALGFSPNEIKALLIDYGYSDFVNLIGDHQGVQVTGAEEAFLSLLRKIIRSHPEAIPCLESFLESICRLSGIDCSDELKGLRSRK